MNTFKLRRHLGKLFNQGASHAEVYQAGIAQGEDEKTVSKLTSMLPDRDAAKQYSAVRIGLVVLLLLSGLLLIGIGTLMLIAGEMAIMGAAFIVGGALNIVFARMAAINLYAGYTVILVLTILGIRHHVRSIMEGDVFGFVGIALSTTIILLCIIMLRKVFLHTSFFGKRLIPQGAEKGFWE